MAEDFVFSYPLEGDDKAQFIADCVWGSDSQTHSSRSNQRAGVRPDCDFDGARRHDLDLSWARASGQYASQRLFETRRRMEAVCLQACPINP